MKLQDFEIGKTFISTAGETWLCTDKGSRVIVAILVDENQDPSWRNGPPYAVAETVFDEYDYEVCCKDMEEYHATFS